LCNDLGFDKFHLLSMNQRQIYYLAIVIIFVICKLLYSIADNNHLIFMIFPVNYGIEQMTGSSSFFIPENGYYFPVENILIDKSCSGFNFWMLAFTLYSFQMIYHSGKRINIYFLPIMFLMTYIFTLFTNTSRILISIKMLTIFNPTILKKNSLTHEAIGGFVFIFFFILFYLIIQNALLKDSHENLTQS
jgi:exosortase K